MGRRTLRLSVIAQLCGWAIALSFSSAFAAATPIKPHDWASEVSAVPIDWQGMGRPQWADTFGTSNNDLVNHITLLREGTLVATGFVDSPEESTEGNIDVVLRKYALDGRVIWTRRIGGADFDAGWKVKELADGRLAVGGFSGSSSAGGNDAYLIIVDKNGEPITETRYGGPAEDRATDLVVAPDGGLLLVGQTESYGSGERDVFLVRTDDQGRELWRKAYGGPGVDRGFYGAAVDDGFVISGVTGVQGNYDFLLLKVDDDGRELWRRVVAGDQNDANHGVTVLHDGRIIFIGYTQSWGATKHDIVALTYSPAGELLRHEIIGGPGDDRVQASMTGSDGSTWIVGYTNSYSAGDWNVGIVRLTKDGNFEPWMGSLGSAWNDTGASLLIAPNGDLYIGGNSGGTSMGKSPPDAFVVRLRPEDIRKNIDGLSVRAVR